MKLIIKDLFTLPRGYSYGQKTSYSGHHLGQDFTVKMWTEVFAPTDGEITNVVIGQQGGLTVHFKDKWGKTWRFMHLVKSQGKEKFKEGQVICWSGNSGNQTTGAHLHVDISKGAVNIKDWTSFYDPLIYIKEKFMADLPSNKVILSKADDAYYWSKDGGKLFSISHDRYLQAAMMAVCVPVEESLRDKVTGIF
jgi:murein DD-endopeptidase MepM/ murein hydrolase activator NlpD